MSNPNIVNVTAIYGQVSGTALTTSNANIIVNTAASDKVYKVNAILVSNVDGANSVALTLGLFDSSANIRARLGSTISVPADSTLDFLNKSIYLNEGDYIFANASANSSLEIVASWEEIN
jgi:hypothetical protein